MTAYEPPLAGVYELLDPGPGQASVLVLETSSPLNPHLCGFLSEHERSRCNRYRHPEDRESSALMWGMLRLGAGILARQHPSEVALGRNGLGRPFLVGKEESGLDLNASRARSCCGLMLARGGRCGIDIERLEPSIVTEGLIGELALDEGETASMRSDPGVFFTRWARTEAVLKADGRGLSRGPGFARRMEAGADGNEWWETDRVSCLCRPIRTPPSFVGMAAFSREGTRKTEASAVSQLASYRLERLWA